MSSVQRCILEVGLWCGDVCLKAWLRDDFEIDGGSIWVVNEWESGVFFPDFGSFWVFFKLSDNLLYMVVKGYFEGVSKSVSKCFIELCGDFVQFWGGGYGRGVVFWKEDSRGWILWLTCEWNTYPHICKKQKN